jgi:hypothetical protein
MRIRLRDAHSVEQLGNIYSKPHNHLNFADHIQRVNKSIELLKAFNAYESIADLSAGDATIINALESSTKHIGDFAPGYEFTGNIDQTIDEIPGVDLFICSETLEHLDDPETTLKKIRLKTKYLFVSTPCGEKDNNNIEHYWGWDADDVKQMLIDTGFDPVQYFLLEFPGGVYDFQMWICK